DARVPGAPRARLPRVAYEVVELRRPAPQRLVDLDVLVPVEADALERMGDELLDRVRLAARDHVVAGLVLLQHQPHRADVVTGVAPVAPRREVAEPHLPAPAERDLRRRERDLPRDEVERPARRL